MTWNPIGSHEWTILQSPGVGQFFLLPETEKNGYPDYRDPPSLPQREVGKQVTQAPEGSGPGRWSPAGGMLANLASSTCGRHHQSIITLLFDKIGWWVFLDDNTHPEGS